MRLIEALAERRLPAWPFDGRVVFREANDDNGIEQAHVFDRWCLVGTARDELELDALCVAAPQAFDADIYKLLCKRLAKSQIGVDVLVRD